MAANGRFHPLPRSPSPQPGRPVRHGPVIFEKFVAHLFRQRGYQVKRRGGRGDHGVDLEMRQANGKKAVVQCKRYSSNVGPDVVRELFGVLIHERAAHAFLVTSADISASARQWASDKPMTLIDGEALLKLANVKRDTVSGIAYCVTIFLHTTCYLTPRLMNDQTHHSYQQIAADFAAATQDRGPILADMALFAEGLPAASLVVDVGCGPGFDAAILRQRYGLKAIGLDYSHAMMVTGREQYTWPFPLSRPAWTRCPLPRQPGGIWACASLLHLTRADLPRVLIHFARLLRPHGRFYLSVKRVTAKATASHAYGQNAPRYFTYWQPHTLDPLLAGPPDFARCSKKQTRQPKVPGWTVCCVMKKLC
jgi:hypothetical protein